MAIVKMKRLRLFALSADRDTLFEQLQKLGCLEISEQTDKLASDEWMSIVRPDEGTLAQKQADADRVRSALNVLNTYAPVKTSIFTPRPDIRESAFLDDKAMKSALDAADSITAGAARISQLLSQINKQTAARQALTPWMPLDAPLELASTDDLFVWFGTCPASTELDALRAALSAAADASELFPASSDRELHYFLILCHRAQEETVRGVLKDFFASPASFKGLTGTAAQNAAKLDEELRQLEEKRQAEVEGLVSFGKARANLNVCADRLKQELQREQSKALLLRTDRVFLLEGWATVPELPQLKALLNSFTCCYEFADPEKGDDVPTLLRNNILTEPLNMVTEMYSLPAYDGIDPNPLIMPFFTIFFGMMYADIGYGLILFIIGMITSSKIKVRGTVQYMMRLLVMCGVTSTFFGFLFGSFFGDAIPVICGLIGVPKIELWALISPLNQPMLMLEASLVVGAIHLVAGMIVDFYMKCRDGHPLDAVFDDATWWLVFIGIGVGALGHGWYVLLAGTISLILTQGRDKPTLVGKLFGGLASLYNITSWLGDVLSYTRLMALLLASSVIASVVNILGSLSGSLIVFIVVFLVGHTFNMGINLIGTYVHTARLQFLEFFGKFYKDGGRAFRPLSYQTTYVNLVKEETNYV